MNVMIMMCVEQGALNSPVIRMILHCQGPMLPSPARIWSPSALSLPASSSTSPMVTAGHTCKINTGWHILFFHYSLMLSNITYMSALWCGVVSRHVQL